LTFKIKSLKIIKQSTKYLFENTKFIFCCIDHCMVDFIRPNLLGSIKDFTNRFINPITNGQYSDSNVRDVKIMKRRSHVLHRMLEGFVQVLILYKFYFKLHNRCYRRRLKSLGFIMF